MSDSGRGFTAEPAGGQGLGLMLMRELCDAFEIRDRPCDGVEVWMMFAAA